MFFNESKSCIESRNNCVWRGLRFIFIQVSRKLILIPFWKKRLSIDENGLPMIILMTKGDLLKYLRKQNLITVNILLEFVTQGINISNF